MFPDVVVVDADAVVVIPSVVGGVGEIFDGLWLFSLPSDISCVLEVLAVENKLFFISLAIILVPRSL